MENNDLAKLVKSLDIELFTQKSNYPKPNAQMNLSGRTHYAEDGTLRYFHARILAARESCSGLVFRIIESVAADPDNRSRGFRYVAFDVFGTVLERVNLDSLSRTSEQANKAYYKWLDGFDVTAHYRAILAHKANELQREADQMCAACSAIDAAKDEIFMAAA